MVNFSRIFFWTFVLAASFSSADNDATFANNLKRADGCSTPPSRPNKYCSPGTCQLSQLGCSLTSSQTSCETNCNNKAGCISYIYTGSSGGCFLYGDCTCPTTCGSDRPTPPNKDCQPGTCAFKELSCSLASNQAQCETNCNNKPGCYAINYNGNNGYCVLYGDCQCPTKCTGTLPVAYQDCMPGTCKRTTISCSLASSQSQCETNCNNSPSCYAINYNGNSGNCVLYGTCQCPTKCSGTQPAAYKDCQPGTCKRTTLSCSIASSLSQCETNCNNSPSCIAINYNGNTGYCNLYGDCQCPTKCTGNPPANYKYCSKGRCKRTPLSCSLTSSQSQCVTNCNNSPSCFAINYDSSNGNCELYGDCQCP